MVHLKASWNVVFTVREGEGSSEAAGPSVDSDVEHLLAAEALDEEGALCKLGQWVRAPHLGDHPASGHLFYMLKVYVRPAPGQILSVLGFWNLLEFDFLQ